MSTLDFWFVIFFINLTRKKKREREIKEEEWVFKLSEELKIIEVVLKVNL